MRCTRFWKHHPEVQLVVPGPATSHTATLQALTGELKLNDCILFLGAITEEELNRLYEGAAVYVYPAPEEDFGMGVIESMAKGVPVVAWNQAGPTVYRRPPNRPPCRPARRERLRGRSFEAA